MNKQTGGTRSNDFYRVTLQEKSPNKAASSTIEVATFHIMRVMKRKTKRRAERKTNKFKKEERALLVNL